MSSRTLQAMFFSFVLVLSLIVVGHAQAVNEQGSEREIASVRKDR